MGEPEFVEMKQAMQYVQGFAKAYGGAITEAFRPFNAVVKRMQDDSEGRHE